MRVSSNGRPVWARLLLLAGVMIAASGCSRTKYRLQADRDAYGVIAERNGDPRWSAADYSIEIDRRSRYFDVYDPDYSPMPPDDPASHRYMHLVDGMKGWKHWHDNGDRIDLENPEWQKALAEYVEIGENGAVKLDVDSALRLAYIHSPSYQRQLETLYLSALDVAAERFRLDTQFFGGYDARYAHNGSLIPPQLSFSPLLNRFIITPSIDGPGVENNRVTLGRPFGANPALQARRRFATAGELLAGFANSFVFEFTGGDGNLSASLANFSFIQPLLRGAGRDIALEQLTLEERNLLSNLRAYGQFRQGFYTQIAIGELGVTGPQRGGSSTSLQSFSGQGGVNGYLGLLQQGQQIRNSEDNLSLQLRTLDRLQALYDNELIDLVQVDQFRQSIEVQRSGLLDQYNSLKLAIDNYKIDTLGLPPNLPVNLDESMVSQFQLFPREANPILESLFKLQVRVGDVAELVDLAGKTAELQVRVGELPNDDDVEAIDRTLGDFLSLTGAIQSRLDVLPADLAQLKAAGETSLPALTDAEKELIQFIRKRLLDGPADVQQHFKEARARLKKLSDDLSAETKEAIVNENIDWLRELLRLSQGCVLVQSRAHRLDTEPKKVLADAFEFIGPVRQLFDIAREDVARMDAVVPTRETTMTEKEKELFLRDRMRLHQRLSELEKDEKLGFDVSVAKLERLRDGLTDETRVRTVRGIVAWVQVFLQIVERLSLVPAQARLEVITVESLELEADEAFQVALAHRLDFMNGRAALVDRWRLLQVNADALQSVLNLTSSGDIRTAKNNPVSFRAPTGSFRMGLEFDAPFTRLLERNAYRESLIEYQRNRRNLIQSRDSLQRGLRALIRTLEQRRQQLEIQRRAVSIAMRQVDQTQLSLNTPPAPLQPGARPSINPTTAINLLSAQGSLQRTQNDFLAAWLRYYAARLRLYRELGIMELDSEGRWIENPLDELNQAAPAEEEGTQEMPLPAMIPAGWIKTANHRETDRQPNVVIQPAGDSATDQPAHPRQSPPTSNAGAKSSRSATNGFGLPQERD